MISQARILRGLVLIFLSCLGPAACALPQASSTLASPTAVLAPSTSTPIPSTSTPVPSTPTPVPDTPTPGALVIDDGLRLREGPGLNFPVIGSMKRQDPLIVTERSADNKWVKVITAEGQQGWCASEFVRLNVDLEKVAIAPEVTQIAGAASQPTTVALTPTPPVAITPSPRSQESSYILYFYFAPEGCPYCRQMAPIVQRFYQEYDRKASGFSQQQYFTFSAPHGPPLDEDKPYVEVYGVPILSWGNDVEGFNNATGVTFPVGRAPSRRTDTNTHPVTVLYDKQGKAYHELSRGAVAFDELKARFLAVRRGEAFNVATGPA